MKYLGGKAKIARHLVRAINREVGPSTPCWEPFMGGGNMTVCLARTRGGIASDAHPALMAMWMAAKQGWRPPAVLTESEHRAARELPDSDPLKAFAGFGCSWGGLWFHRHAADMNRVLTRWNPRSGRMQVQVRFDSAAREARNAIVRLVRVASAWEFERLSFFDREPGPSDRFIYADPPYAARYGYTTGEFPHALFWKRCQEWARFVPVIVSEYACPVPHRLLFEMKRTVGLQRRSAESSDAPVERLFRVLPAGPRMRMRRMAVNGEVTERSARMARIGGTPCRDCG